MNDKLPFSDDTNRKIVHTLKLGDKLMARAVSPIAQLQEWKANQWDCLVAHITRDERNQRFVIYDETLALYGIDIRDDHIEEHCTKGEFRP
ncbi:unnamed protein product, partial [marine sediment metagenome]